MDITKAIFLSIFFMSLGFISNNQAQSWEEALSDESILRDNVTLTYEKAVNTDLWEYAPAYYRGGIVYVGTRRNFKVIDRTHNTPFFTLKYAEINPDKSLAKPVSFNIEGAYKNHDGPITFYSQNKKILFTKSLDLEETKSRRVPLHIYKAELKENGWVADSLPLSFQSLDNSYAHPAIDEENNIVYFSSDMPGGYGGMDLWKVEFTGSRFTAPENLGPSINSDGNDVFPTLNNGILFFSSDGRKKGKDLDLYYSYTKDDMWIEAVPLAYPFNSPKDDLSLIIAADGRSGYFSSQRAQGEGKDDIIRFDSDISLIDNATTSQKINLIALDMLSNKRLSGIKVWVFEADVNGLAKNKEFYESRFDQLENGELSLRLKLKDESQLPKPTTYTGVDGTTEITLQNSLPYLVVAADSEYIMKAEFVNLADTLIDELQFNMKFESCVPFKYDINSDSELDNNIKVVLKNECNGTKDTMTLNQKDELIDDVFSENPCLNPDCYYTIIAQSTGFTSDTVIILSGRSSRDTNLIELNLLRSAQVALDDVVKVEKGRTVSISEVEENNKIKEGDIITLRNIYYDYNKSAIRKGAAIELDALIRVMNNNPTMEVELNSFTDSRGSEQYNLILSLERAESAKDYLISHGIDESRIKAVGYGESMINNRCKDNVECSEKEHEENRRTEVRITVE